MLRRIALPLLLALLSASAALAAPAAVYLAEDFSGAGQKFFSDETIDSRRFSYVDGQYEIDTTAASTYGQSVLLDDLATYRLQATGRLVSSTEANGGGFGLSFNYREGGSGSPNFLLFLVYNAGAYTVLRYYDEKTDVLVPPARTKLFKPGEAVTLTVDNTRGQLVFYINGVESATLSETALTSGGYGMFTTAQSVARFDDFKVLADRAAPTGGFSDAFDGTKVLYEGGWGEVAYRYEGGRYVIDTSGTGYIGLSPFPEPRQDLEFSADVSLISGDPVGGYGLYLRDYEAGPGKFNQFRFLVSGGWFAVERSVGDRPLALAQWSESDAVNATGVNHLRVRADGGDLVFFVNEREVYRAVDDAPKAGAFGFFASGGIVAAFDNAKMIPLR